MLNMLQRCSGLWQWQQRVTEGTGLGDCGFGGGMMLIRWETKTAETENRLLSTCFTTTTNVTQHHIHLISAHEIYKTVYTG